MKIKAILTIMLFFPVSFGCATTKIWTSDPPAQYAENPHFKAGFEPLKTGDKFYEMFRLTLDNKTDGELEIDWNKTRFIYDGRGFGGFAFRGIKPEDIKNGTIASDVVPPKQRFSKTIAPVKLIAWAPLKDKSVPAGERGIFPGPLKAGENGIFLVVLKDGQEIREKITVILRMEEDR